MSVSLPLGGLTVRWTVRRNHFFLNPWWLAEGQTDEGEPCGVVLRLISLSFCDVKGRERRSKPISLPCWKKEWFLESKEKGAPVGVRWLQIGIRRPVFTPP